MALRGIWPFRRPEGMKDKVDGPLNDTERLENIRTQIRRLNVEKHYKTIKTTYLLLLLSSVGMAMLRKYKLGTVFVAGLLLERAFAGPAPAKRRQPGEIDLERRALKMERGDYGKVEVIPFR